MSAITMSVAMLLRQLLLIRVVSGIDFEAEW